MAAQANTVSLVTNFNTAPYYDDFDESKNFHRILFRPGLAVQARELTQLQTMLQNQIDRFAEHVFKEGSPVRGMEISPLDTTYEYVKLKDNTSTGASVNVYSFSSKLIKGATSGVIAKVVNVNDGSQANTPNFKTFFVDYISANTTTGYKTFANNEILTCVTDSTLKANTIQGALGGATGLGSSIRIKSGIIFAKDNFIRVDDQTLVLDKYTNTPTYRVGYTITESIISSSDDSSLLDPASGSYNYAAPGASRLKLTATLTKTTNTAIGANNFVEYVNIKNGIIQSETDATQYSIIRDELAKRTADESGDYIVRGLSTRVREHLLSGNNQGVYTLAQGGNTYQISVDVQPGKAYVQGYDNELLTTQHVAIDKGIDYNTVSGASVYADYGNYIYVTQLSGNFDIMGQDYVSLRGSGVAFANSVSNRTYSNTAGPGLEIGKARVRGLEYYSGTPGLPNAIYKLYLHDIRITRAGSSFANTESISFNSGAGNGHADVWLATTKSANTTDQGFNTAVVKLPAQALRALRTSANAVNASYGFYKQFGAEGTTVSLNATGNTTIDSTTEGGSASETFSGSGKLSTALARQNFHVVARTSGNTTAITGTVSTTSGSNTVTGSGTAFTTQVNPGDLIRIANTGANYYLVTQVVSDTSLKLSTTVGSTRTGVPLWKKFLAGQVLDFGGFGKNGARSITISSATTAALDLKETLNTTFNIQVLAKLTKSTASEATKNIVRNRLVRIKMGASANTGYTANTSGPWPLGLADGFRLVSVRKSASAFAATTDGTDVTSEFYLDNGQRDSFYDHARLVKKPTSSLSISGSDWLLVTLDHFTHTNRQLGFFSINSYPVNDANTNSAYILTYQIPVFTSPVTGLAYDLRDCIDFRPRLTDSANSVSTLTGISTNPLGLDTPNYTLLTAAAGSADLVEPTGGLHFPYSGSLFTADLSYYLPRKDLVVMTKTGKLQDVRGVSSKTPLAPQSDADKMTLAILSIAPYPSLPDNIAKTAGRGDLANSLQTIKNERFTMRDIGGLRDRIDALEYYTTLTLLEKSASDLTIRDTSGNDRFKNGFMVDGFTGHSVGNVYDPDYAIAIDPNKKEARPPAKVDNLELFYNAANSSNVVRTNVTTTGVSRDQLITISNSQVAFSNGSTVTSGGQTAYVRYKIDNKLYLENSTGNFAAAATVTSGLLSATIVSVTPITPGKLIMLPYTHERVVNQPFASTTRDAAGLFYNWIGNVTLDPNNDYWVDTTVAPDVQVNVDNSVDNWEILPNTFGSQWGSWQSVISGLNIHGRLRNFIAGAVGQVLSVNRTDVTVGQTRTPGLVDTSTTGLQTYTQGGQQQVVGSQLGTSLSTQQQIVGNTVRDTNIQPFMRSRVVKVTLRAMKPSSRLYCFFDTTDVTAYITPCDSTFTATGAEGSALTTNASGDAYALFRIPNTSGLRFRVGDKIFRATDSPTNESEYGLCTTVAQCTYSSSGLTPQEPTITPSTTPPDTTINTVVDPPTLGHLNDVITQIPAIRGDRILGPKMKADPICQSFTVDCLGFGQVHTTGAFLTKVDLFFAEKDPTLPCIIEIREIDPISGYPTPKVVPYSRTIIEAASINTSTDGSKPTPVYLTAPVYLQDGKDYGLVIIPGGGSPHYRLWVAVLGQNDKVTGNRIITQPATGMLFASSNDTTYTALQEEDLKFNLYFANFNVSTTGSIIFKNERKDFVQIANLTSTTGFTTIGEEVRGETYLKGTFVPGAGLTGNVAHDQSYAQGMTSGATGILTYLSAANGDLRLKKVTGAFKGGEAIRFRLVSNTGTIAGNSTGGIKFAQYPTGKVSFFDNVTGSNTYLHIANVTYANSGPATGTHANNQTFDVNRWIKGQVSGISGKISLMDKLNADLINVKGDFITPSNTSVTPSAKFATSTSARDTAYQTINLNDDTAFSARRFVLSRSVESNTSLSFSGMKDGSAEVKLALVTSNRYGSPVFDVTRISTTIVETQLNNTTTGESNTVNGGSAKARYITRKMILADGQDAEDIRAYVDAYVPPNTGIAMYYKVLNAADSDTFDKQRWQPMDTLNVSSSVQSASDNPNDFIEFQFQPKPYPTGAVQFASGLYGNSNPSNVLSYRNSLGAFYQRYKYLAIKIVLYGTNTTNPPRIRNLRVIALQK